MLPGYLEDFILFSDINYMILEMFINYCQYQTLIMSLIVKIDILQNILNLECIGSYINRKLEFI